MKDKNFLIKCKKNNLVCRFLVRGESKNKSLLEFEGTGCPERCIKKYKTQVRLSE